MVDYKKSILIYLLGKCCPTTATEVEVEYDSETGTLEVVFYERGRSFTEDEKEFIAFGILEIYEMLQLKAPEFIDCKEGKACFGYQFQDDLSRYPYGVPAICFCRRERDGYVF